MIRRLRILVLCAALAVGVSGASAACRHHPNVVTPQGQVAYSADQIVLRVNELQNAAIQAEASGGLSTDATRKIVQFAVSANQTLKATPNGWRATVKAGWSATKVQLPAITNPAVQAAIAALEAVLEAA